MKNIFVLPSDKPSRLAYDFDEKCYYLQDNVVFFEHQDLIENRNIYITNSEEIKEGDYGIGHATGLFGVGEKDYLFKHDGSKKGRINSICVGAKKIVLCTDPELIKNGVQAIDDDFLEFFVKNPSCEFVEVDRVDFDVDMGLGEECIEYNHYYKPIIPQPKQETIDEVAERILANNIDGLKDLLNDDDLFYFYKGVIINYGVAVAEHQSEKTFIKVKNSELLLPITDKNYLNVVDLYGKKYNIEPVCGTNPKLKLLDSNQSVVYGDGETYHFLLTEK